jgi:hypothetical protein
VLPWAERPDPPAPGKPIEQLIRNGAYTNVY